MPNSQRSDAQRRAESKYKKSLASITIRLKHDHFERISVAADTAGLSMRAFILQAVDARCDEVLGPVSVAEDPAPESGD